MILLDIEGKITHDNEKTNISHSFFVPEGAERLIINFSYSPKNVSSRKAAINIVKDCFEKYNEPMIGRPNEYLPVGNLITLSLDCGGKYIGAAHREGDKQTVIISPKLSTPGFIKTDITEGDWRVCVNLHSVNCDMRYNIKVEGVMI